MSTKFLTLSLFIVIAAALGGGWLYWHQFGTNRAGFLSPLGENLKPKPLNRYRISALATETFVGQPIAIAEKTAQNADFTTYIYRVTTLGKSMTGQLNIPRSLETRPTPTAAIVLLRGYVPAETYVTGVGTKNAAAVFARHGYITVAPDFFGLGGSDPEPENTWQARFEKPIIVAELLASLEQHGVPSSSDSATRIPISKQGIWAHSNGGQIALTTLEITKRPVPTTLWAPVTAPFPYSVLFFSDEIDDEGKAMRLWVSQFEADYNAHDFSLTKYLDLIAAPLQLHQGVQDEAIPKVWSDEFVAKLKANDKTVEYFVYPTADHNLQPNWSTAIERDLTFFAENLNK